MSGKMFSVVCGLVAGAALVACSFDGSTDVAGRIDGGPSQPPADGAPAAVDAAVADASVADAAIADASVPDAAPIDAAPIDAAPIDAAPIDAALPDAAPSPRLVDRGLLVRYFIDEAGSGKGPKQLEDVAPDPLPLAITYGPELSFGGDDGTRHLTWNATGGDGRASVAIDGTKLARLNGSRTATMELVVDIDAVVGLNSRIGHIGSDIESGRFSLTTVAVDRLQVYWNGQNLIGEWPVDLVAAGRVVIHVVVDTNRLSDRVVLYINGVAQTPSAGLPPVRNDVLSLLTGRHFVLGNREIGERSFQGRMHYGALYDEALDATDVQNNADVLADRDDTPL